MPHADTYSLGTRCYTVSFGSFHFFFITYSLLSAIRKSRFLLPLLSYITSISLNILSVLLIMPLFFSIILFQLRQLIVYMIDGFDPPQCLIPQYSEHLYKTNPVFKLLSHFFTFFISCRVPLIPRMNIIKMWTYLI